ncbi:unnamed protein product [Didymodactylos carnosus]|uniref:Uncharacterized protein n=1 Tax=Didymodactylos carnosus TaxID=1234261 RepID=A0A8S2FRJ4_9BILA|nr:unnamed protein product [Didymodactylos carnosus]CAF4329511.1 unnamed protein product [Didymodactylos carnosus]
MNGGHWRFTVPASVSCSKTDFIYLNAGLHVIDVGVRGEQKLPVYVVWGTLSIELVQFDRNVNIGLIPINVTLPNSSG